MHSPIMLRGFSMVEVLVASVIFIVAASGVMSTIAVTSVPVTTNEGTTKAAVFGHLVLDGLNQAVRSGIATGNLSSGAHGPITDATDFPGYTANYNVTVVGTLRKVDLTVTW